MKAFISHSINDSEQFVLSLLADNLREKGFSVTSHFSMRASSFAIEKLAAMNIRESSLFIGVITEQGQNQRKVFAEHNIAVSWNIPALLLVEDNIHLPPDFIDYNVIFFNRKSPHQAIEKINRNIQNVRNPLPNTQNNTNNAAAWLFGGLALIGLVDLLSASNE